MARTCPAGFDRDGHGTTRVAATGRAALQGDQEEMDGVVGCPRLDEKSSLGRNYGEEAEAPAAYAGASRISEVLSGQL